MTREEVEKSIINKDVPLCLKHLRNEAIPPINFEIVDLEKLDKYQGKRSTYLKFYKPISPVISI